MLERLFIIRLLFPLAALAGRFLSEPARERLEHSLIAWNNARIFPAPPAGYRRILLLLPHCLQHDSCRIRLTGTELNCEGCGKCPVGGLLNLSKKYNIIIKVATGGRLAQRIVRGTAPDLIIAVACERELSEGIPDVFPLPVYGLPNLRPSGPCNNTTIDITTVENILVLHRTG